MRGKVCDHHLRSYDAEGDVSKVKKNKTMMLWLFNELVLRRS